MSDIQKNKKTIELSLGEISSSIVELNKKVEEASAVGNTQERDSLLNDIRILGSEAERLQVEYTNLSEQERQPQVEKARQSGEELRKSNAPNPLSFLDSYTPLFNSGSTSMIPPMGFAGQAAVTQPSNEQVTQRQRELIGERFNVPVPTGGIESEQLPASIVAKISTLPSPESKSELLQLTYPNANIAPVDVGGNTEFLLKFPDGSTKTTLQKGVASLAGVPVEGAVAAAEGATFAGALGATRSPGAALALSSLAGAGVGSAIDEGLRFIYGMEPDIGNTLARRGTEGLLSLGTGMVSDVAIPAMRAARIESPFENQFAKTLETAQERLMTREQKLAARQGRQAGEIQVPTGAKLGGQEGMEMQSELAGTYPRSNIAASARTTQETLRRLLDDYKSGIPVDPNKYADIAVQMRAQKEALAQQVAAATGKNKLVIEAALDRQTQGAASNTDELGNILLSSIKNAEDEVSSLKNRKYDELRQIANAGGFKIDAKEFLNMLPSIKARVNAGGAMNEAAVNSVEKDLLRIRDAPVLIADTQSAIKRSQKYLRSLAKERNSGKKLTKKRLQQIEVEELRTKNEIQDLSNQVRDLQSINKPLDFDSFDAFIRRFSDARPDSAVGGTTKDAFGVAVSNELSALRRQIYGKVNATLPDGRVANLGQEFEKATALVQERNAYEKNLLGGILKEVAGEQAKTPRDIVSAVLKEPATIDRVTRSLRELGQRDKTKAGEADRVLGLLQTEYLNRIGIKPNIRGRGARVIEADENMVRSLFGSRADAQLRSLNDLNENLRKIGRIDKVDLTQEEILQMGQALSENERKELTKNIANRIQAQREEEALARSTIFKMAEKGNFENIDADSLSYSILANDTTIDQTQQVMKQLSRSSLEARNLYKGDFRRALLDKYAGGKPSAAAPFTAFFDTERFIKDYKPTTGETAFARKIQSVLGKEEADFLYDLAVTAEANYISNATKGGATMRTVGSPQGVTVVLPLQQLATSARNRVLAGLLSTGTKSNALKTALARNALPGEVNKAYMDMSRQMFLTRQGVEALAHQASSDPEFSAELVKMARDFEEKERLNNQEK